MKRMKMVCLPLN